MAKSLFDKLQADASAAKIKPRTKESREWFIERVKDLRAINRTSLLNSDNLTKVTVPKVGHMYMYFYDPKTKETLPYYDRFPLVIMVEPVKDGFYGLNLHYLPPVLRAKMLDGLLDITNNNRYDETTKMKIRYDMLTSIRKLRWYEPCFKRYLFSNVQRRMVMVEAKDWETAVFLPMEQFAKARKTTVWRDSRNSLGL